MLLKAKIVRKMWYYGKKRDTFSYAMNMLCVENGYGKFSFWDCISIRAFCLECQKDIRWWFSSAISVPQAVENINCHIFGGENVVKYREHTTLTAEERHMLLQEGCVIGPIRQRTSIAHLQDRFYQGCHQYLFLKRDSTGCIGVTDPLGTPIYFEADDDGKKIFQWSDHVIWISSHEATARSMAVNWNAVLTDGFNWHTEYCKHPHSVERYNFSDN